MEDAVPEGILLVVLSEVWELEEVVVDPELQVQVPSTKNRWPSG